MTFKSVAKIIFPFTLTSLLGGCASNFNPFTASDEDITKICERPTSDVSIAMTNQDYAQTIQILKSFPKQCTDELGKRVLEKRYFYYDYDLGEAYFKTGNNQEALKHFDLAVKSVTYPYYYNATRIYRTLLLAYLEPANHVTHLNEAAKLIISSGEKNGYFTYYLNNAKYDYGDRSPDILKSYLHFLDDEVSPEYFTTPIALAQELGQTKIAKALIKRQQELADIKSRAIAQNIPGLGTASGNVGLLVKRDAFYLSEYSRIGMNDKIIDFYKTDLQKHVDLAKARAEQSAIDRANAAAEEAEKRQQQMETLTSLTGLVSTVIILNSSNNNSKQAALHSASPALSSASTNSGANVTYVNAGTSTGLMPIQAENGGGAATSNGNTSGGSSSSGNSGKLKSSPPANQCITRDTKSNEMADFLINKCNFTVNVQWIGPPYCMDNGGCASGVSANGKSSVTKIASNAEYFWAACPYPSIARAPDGVTRWNKHREFVCIN